MAKTENPNKWAVALTVMFGVFMAVMDITVVNVALPHMMGTFSEDLSAITWVATAYSIAQIIMVTMSGWWSALLGRKRLYIMSLVAFTIGSILAGTSRTFTQMLIYRTIQGFGGGALIPVAQAILREAFPVEEQGTAMSIFGMGVVLAPAAGPVLGGYLTDRFGWPWIFYINVPASIPAVLLALTFLRDPAYLKRGIKSIDWPGIIFLATAVTAMQVVLERGQQNDWFSSHWIIAGTVIAVGAFAALAIRELLTDEPVINVRLLRDVPLTAGCGIGLVFGIALLGTTFILPQLTQSLLGYSAFQSGLVIMPRALALFVFMPIAGYLIKFFDARILIFAGIVLMFWAYRGIAQLSLATGFWNLVPLLLVLGAGMAFMFVTMTSVSLSKIQPKDMTHATSMFTLARLIGGNIGYALVATLVADYTQVHRAQLVKHISALNPYYLAFHGHAAAGIVLHGQEPVSAAQTATALANLTVNRNAAMMAYNDTSYITGLMFILIVPLVFLLPGKLRSNQPTAAAG